MDRPKHDRDFHRTQTRTRRIAARSLGLGTTVARCRDRASARGDVLRQIKRRLVQFEHGLRGGDLSQLRSRAEEPDRDLEAASGGRRDPAARSGRLQPVFGIRGRRPSALSAHAGRDRRRAPWSKSVRRMAGPAWRPTCWCIIAGAASCSTAIRSSWPKASASSRRHPATRALPPVDAVGMVHPRQCQSGAGLGRRSRRGRRAVARYRRQRSASVERDDVAAADPDLRIQQCGAERTRAHHSLPGRTFNYAALPADQALFRSASLAAYVAVSRRKGYRLVGMNALGFNAIFLRDDVLAAEMPEIPASALDANPHVAEVRAKWWPQLTHLPWLRCQPMESSDVMPRLAAASLRCHPCSIARSGSWSAFRVFRRPQHLRRTLQSLADQRTERRFAVVVVENDALGVRERAGRRRIPSGRQVSGALRGRAAAGQLPRHQCRVRDRAGDVSRLRPIS